MQNFWYNLLFFCAITVVSACANIVAPSGGPADYQPPAFVKSEPLPASTQFTGKKITLRFDEFIALSDPFNKVTISPPVKTFPEFRTRGKNVVVDFAEVLKPGVTYSIDFGDCIQDITESNPFKDYRFVFSTGAQIDSMILVGMTINSFTLQAEKDILLLLYRNPYDSIPYKEIPDFIAKSKADGSFAFSNLPSGKYMLLAIQDVNSNMMYEPASESIGFTDSLVVPQTQPVPDTLAKDSIAPDTLKPVVLTKHILYMFDEADTAQRLMKTNTDRISEVKMVFRWPVTQLTYRFLKETKTDPWHLDEYGKERDTMTCWVLDPNIDSLFIEISDKGMVIDTLELGLKRLSDTVQDIKKKPGKGPSESAQAFKLTLTANTGASGMLDLNESFRILFSHPIRDYDFQRIQVQELIDSSGFPVQANLTFTDPGINRHLEINTPWKRKHQYRIIIPQGVFVDIFGMPNDSLKIDFTTREYEDYGILKLNLKIDSTLTGESGQAAQGSYLFQLLNENNVVIRQQNIRAKETLTYEYMHEGNLTARLIFDSNNNGKWDTGNYLGKKQPEHILYYPGIMKIKQNWDTEIDWIIK